MRKSKKAALIIIMSSVYLAGCAAGGEVGVDPSASVSQGVTKTKVGLKPELLEALESKTVDVKGYYITTDIRGSGEKTEKERDKEYQGFLKEIEVIEQSGDLLTIKAYLVGSDKFFTTAERVGLEYNTKDSSIQVKTDPIKVEPTVFFDTSMSFGGIEGADRYQELGKFPEVTEEKIKDIEILEELEGELITKNDFHYNGYVQITDKEDNIYLCSFYLYYKPHEKNI